MTLDDFLSRLSYYKDDFQWSIYDIGAIRGVLGAEYHCPISAVATALHGTQYSSSDEYEAGEALGLSVFWINRLVRAADNMNPQDETLRVRLLDILGLA